MKKSIFLLITLFGVMMSAQAVDYYYKGNQNGWSASNPMAVSIDGYYSYAEAKSHADNGNQNNHFKIAKTSGGWDYGATYLKPGFNNTNITDMGAWDGDGNCCIYHDASYYVIVYHPNTTINTTNNPIICASTTLPYDGDCHLMGVEGDWDNGIKMELNSSDKNVFFLLDQPINGPIKFKLNNTWTDQVENYDKNGVDWKDGNIVLPAGNYDFYFKKDIMKVYIARNTVVTTTANPAEGGTLTGAGVYNNNDDVTLTATANDGYKFVNWTKGGEQVSADATYAFKAAGDVEYVANFVKTPTVTIEDPIGSMSTYTGVEENAGVWSKVYTAGDEVTIGVDQLGDGWLFAYWTIGGEKIFTEEYTFTVTEDVTITANYGMAMDVTFDNMVLDQDSWIVTAGPEAVFGIEVLLGIDTEGEHPKGFGLVDGSSISLGGEELELVTGYFTSVEPTNPSAEAVVFAVYEEMLMAFVCTMTAAPAPVHNIVVENATIDDQTETSGFLFMNGTWSDGTETYPVKAEIPGFDPNVASATYMVTITIGGQGDDDPWLGFGEGKVAVTVNDGLVTLSGSIKNAGSGFAADVTISGTLPAAVTTIDVTLSGMQKGQISRVNKRGYIALEDGAGNNLQIYNESAEWAYGEYTVTGELVEYGVTVQGTGIWDLVDGVETLVATLQVEDDNTTIYNVTATVGAAQTLTLECFDATYTITDPSLNEVTITGVADGKDFTITIAPDGAGYYSDGEWDGTPILATSVTFDDSDPEAYALEGEYIDDASNTYEVLVFASPAAVAPETYTRDVTNKYGTICLPNAAASTTGAIFYRVAGKEEGKVYLESVDALEAGVPYIFEATAGTITVTYQGEAVAEAGTANGLVGTFTEITVPDGDYILYNNAFCTNESAGTLNKIKENRAYLDMDAVTGGAPQQMPGRKYIGMSTKGENATTGLDNITNGENTVIKTIENGQLIIIRNGEKFNAQGVRF